ncbi:MAG TPA: metallophosphoesterase [Thermoanaerobaculia bacterium]|nr:metallophosphoesterase [Thermoanaerobaculia bacterium]
MSDTRPARLLGSVTRQLRRLRDAEAVAFLGEVVRRSGTFAVVSDMQRTSGVEIWRESNAGERKLIVARIAEERPDFVAILGDLVFHGSSPVDWAEFDELTEPLRAAGLPVLPVLGNHDYWLVRRGALDNFFSRFPHLDRRHFYEVRYGPLTLLFLDSNERFLDPAIWREQRAWYEAALGRLDGDPGVAGVLVLLHHPPYTNSTITRDELHVQRDFVPPFAAATKTLAMIAGHVHSYERFVRGGKTYLVTGGGGGPRAPLHSEHRRRHIDDLFLGPLVRSFHFLLVTPGESEVVFEMVAVGKHGSTFVTEDRFALALHAG